MENKIEVGFKPRTWLLVILIIIALAITVVLADRYITYRKETKAERKSIFEKIQEQVEKGQSKSDKLHDETLKKIEESKKEQEKKSFNYDYEMYAGNEMGASVVWMLDDLITHNKTSKDHILIVKRGDKETTDEEEIRAIKNSLDKYSYYEVVLDYDEDGYVYRINIR